MMGRQQWMGYVKTMGRGMWIVLQGLIILYALWVIGYLIGRQVMAGDDRGLVAVSHNLAPWFGPVGLVLLVAALFSRWRWGLIGLLAPGLIAFAVLYGDLFLPSPTVSAPPGSRVLHVASFNILSPKSDPEQIAGAIRDLGDMDIIGLEEVGGDHAGYIKNNLSDVFPYQLLFPHHPSYAGIGLLSRYPVIAHEVYQPEPYSYLHLRAEIDVEGVAVTVYVAHPHPADNRQNPFRYDSSRRNAEIRDTVRRIKQDSGPVLVLCDCNMPDQSVDYDRMDEVLDDVFRAVGWGFGFTFPAYRSYISSLIRIDYVWYNDRFVALSAETAANPGTSDHRPIQAALALNPGP